MQGRLLPKEAMQVVLQEPADGRCPRHRGRLRLVRAAESCVPGQGADALRVPRGVLDAIIGGGLTRREIQLALALICAGVGGASRTELVSATGLTRSHVGEGVKKLTTKHIGLVEANGRLCLRAEERHPSAVPESGTRCSQIRNSADDGSDAHSPLQKPVPSQDAESGTDSAELSIAEHAAAGLTPTQQCENLLLRTLVSLRNRSWYASSRTRPTRFRSWDAGLAACQRTLAGLLCEFNPSEVLHALQQTVHRDKLLNESGMLDPNLRYTRGILLKRCEGRASGSSTRQGVVPTSLFDVLLTADEDQYFQMRDDVLTGKVVPVPVEDASQQDFLDRLLNTLPRLLPTHVRINLVRRLQGGDALAVLHAGLDAAKTRTAVPEGADGCA